MNRLALAGGSFVFTSTMAESRNGTTIQVPGSSYRNELGRSLPEPFPPPFPPMEAPSIERLSREYVAGGGWAWYGQVARTLPNTIDDATADFGDDLYERMLFDPQVAAVVQIFKSSILETGLTLTSAVRSRSDPDYDIAAEIADEAAHMIAEFDGNLDDVLYNMLDCVALGNKVAEQTYKLTGARKDGRKILVLDTLKVRPRRSTVFAVDIYMNVIGLLIRVPPNASPWSSTMMFGPQDEPFNLLPPHKFVITNFRTRDGDPRGNSLLRPAYGPWWQKQQLLPEWLRYLTQFASPSIYGIVGENAVPQPDMGNPGASVTVEQMLLQSLQQFRNGTAAAFPFGTVINTVRMEGDGSVFLRAFDHCDQQITKAVLTQELATEEGQHMARAAAQVHQDVLDTIIRQAKHGFGRQFRNQLFKRWVSYNWGDAARHLAPVIGLGKSISREQPALWTSIAQLYTSGYLAPSQQQAVDEQVGLPVRDESEVIAFGDMPANQGKAPAGGDDAGNVVSSPPPMNDDKTPALPDPPEHKKTPIKPSVPDRVGVAPHTRSYPQRQVATVVEPHSAGLPSASPGTFG